MAAKYDTHISQDNLNWRVLDVKDGQLRLISEKSSGSSASATDFYNSSHIAFANYNGYNNAVKILDDACKILYTNKKLASNVQNLKIEDIQEKMKKDYKSINSNYGKTVTLPGEKYYPSILLEEKGQKVNGKDGNKLDISEQENIVNQTENIQADSLEVKATYWSKYLDGEDFYNSTYYDMFYDGQSYLSSRCIDLETSYEGDNYAVFGIYSIDYGSIGLSELYTSGGGGNSFSMNYLRPCVTINSNIELDTSISADGSSPSKAYVLK